MRVFALMLFIIPNASPAEQITCAAGDYRGTGYSEKRCFECTEGRYQPVAGAVGENTCKPCPAGKFQPLNRGPKVFVVSGTIDSRVRNPPPASCRLCPNAKYQDNAGQIVCKTCFQYRYMSQFASGSTACGGCRKGYYSDGKMTTCEKCPIGKYRSTDIALIFGLQPDSKCDTCSNGQVTNDGTNCEVCPAGKFRHVQNGIEPICRECPPGKFQPNTGNSTCNGNVCPTGKHGPAGQISDVTCNACPTGKYQDEESQETCKITDQCPDGNFYVSINTTIQDKCNPCPPGKYKNPNSNNPLTDRTCDGGTLCPTGKFGVFGATSANEVCKTCPKGKFQEQAGQHECKSCSEGKFGNANAAGAIDSTAADCTACPEGRFQAQAGQPGCEDCPMDKFQDSTGQTVCKNCVWPNITLSPGATHCEKKQIDMNYFPGFVKTEQGAGFSAGIGPGIYTPLKKHKDQCIHSQSVTIPQLHDGAQAGVIQTLPGILDIVLEPCCNASAIECIHGDIVHDTCTCSCYPGFKGVNCNECNDPNAVADDLCQSCKGNFRKNTLGKCSLCKFGYANPGDSGCTDCLVNLDPADKCRSAKCKNIKVKGETSFNTIVARDKDNRMQLVDGMYMPREAVVPPELQNKYVELKNSKIKYFISDKDLKLVDHMPLSHAVVDEQWWIWTLPYNDKADESKAEAFTPPPTPPPSPSTTPAASVEEKYLYAVVCTHDDPDQKYVLGPYTKHKYSGPVDCTKIDTALVQRLPLAQPYNNTLERAIKIPDISDGSALGQKTECVSKCANDAAWTYHTPSKMCTCSSTVPITQGTTPTFTIAGGVVKLPNEAAAIEKIALLDEEKKTTMFAETAAVCCSKCAKLSHNFYMRDGFNCHCYDVNTNEVQGDNVCDGQIIVDTTNPFFGKKHAALNSSKSCDRKQGCIKHELTCVEVETFEQSDELQFGETSVCSGTNTEFVKVFLRTTDSKPTLIEADETLNCKGLHWSFVEHEIYFPNGLVVPESELKAKEKNSNTYFKNNKVFVRPTQTVTPTVTAVQVTQNVDINACTENIGYIEAIAQWSQNGNIHSAKCLGQNNCPAQAKSITNQLLELQEAANDAQLRCKSQETMLNDQKSILILKECGTNKVPFLLDCIDKDAPTPPPPLPTPPPPPPPPTPPPPPNTTLNNNCLYEQTNHTFAGSIPLQLHYSINLTEALTRCTFSLVCSHVQDTNNTYQSFAHTSYNAITDRETPKGKLSATSTTYFKRKPCLLT